MNELYLVRFCNSGPELTGDLFLDHLSNSWTLRIEDPDGKQRRLFTGDFAVDSLPVPPNLVALDTDQGMNLFLSASHKYRALSLLQSYTS